MISLWPSSRRSKRRTTRPTVLTGQRLKALCKLSTAIAVAAVNFTTLLETAQAFSLSVYGGGGYDMVSSQPDTSQGENLVAPEPSGPSYGLGVSTEFGPFGPAGIALSLGLSGFHSTWESEQAKDVPGGIVLSSIGVGLGLDLNLYFGGFVVGAGGSFHYGFSDTYDVIINEPARTFENDVTSMMRFAGHLGIGYTVAGFTIMGRFGGGAYMVSLVPPPTTARPNPEEVQDVYTGLMFGLVASYAIIGPESASGGSKQDELRSRSDEPEKKKKKKKKKRKPRKKKEG